MRVIIKPAGLLCLVSAFVLLASTALWRYRTTPSEDPFLPTAFSSPVPPPAAAASAAAADAVAGERDTPPPSTSTPVPEKAARLPPAVKRPLPEGVLLMPDISSKEWRTLTTRGKTTSTIVPAGVPGHPLARRIRVEEVGTNHWDLQYAHLLQTAFQKGKRVRLTYWARSKDSCPMAATVEQSAAPYDKVVYREERLTPEWKQYTEEWEQKEDTPPGWAKVDFQVGYKVGEIEITGVNIRLAEKTGR